MKKRTKIVCTIGPACESVEMLVKMIGAGMNVARLNFSHGSHENHTQLYNNIREASRITGEPVAILQDLQGPKIRVGVLPEEGVVLTAQATLVFDTALSQYAGEAIPVDYHELHQYLKAGERLLLSDGKMETKIVSVEGTRITTIVTAGGTLTSHKGINVPDSTLTVRAMSEKDKDDARFGLALGVDFIALSFVRSAEDILDLRAILGEEAKAKNISQTPPIKIIAKIERREAVEGIESILEVVDGIMVARGDLGLEIPGEQVPVIQKQLTMLGIEYHKPVIVATQMMDSMEHSPRATRAEVSDVANAVIDHTGAVMLSNESAVGEYPIETVETMARILVETEASKYDYLRLEIHETKGDDIRKIMEELGRLLAEKVGAAGIVLLESDEEQARMMSSFRPELPIFAFAHDERTVRQLNLNWGVIPLLSSTDSQDAIFSAVKTYFEKNNIVGSEVIVVGPHNLEVHSLV